jgi:cysteine desulfurase/selenocysteine lyase
MMRDPPVKKILYWCDRCDVPLIGERCGCGAVGRAVQLQAPFDVRPALTRDMTLITDLIRARFSDVPIPKIVLLNKAGGIDRNELVIIHGERFGWLSFDPVTRRFRFDLTPEGLPFIIPHAGRGIIDLERAGGPDAEVGRGRRIGGKKIAVRTKEPDGSVIVSYRGRYGTGILKDGAVRVRELHPVNPRITGDPSWHYAVERNRYHLKNLERNAIRSIRQHIHDRPTANVSFSGGKDSTAVLALARKAGVSHAFFIDTGIEFPETVAFVRSQGVEVIQKAGDFWAAVEKAGPPAKDHRWCCKLLKLNPLKLHLAGVGPCVTIQGNRWYESWNRADLDITSQNPANPLQLNISPIRNWRALEVFLYLWWQGLPYNPLYDQGLERIGCYLCPAMLESEHEGLRTLHPDLAARWDAFLARWTEDRGLPGEYASWGLWRWKEMPPKMQELCKTHEVPIDPLPSRVMTRQPVTRAAVATGTDPLEEARKDFPMLADIVYLDSAATSISPEPVLEAMLEYEHHYRANVGRSVHRLAQIATQRYWHAHEKVARFIGGEDGVTVFTKNCTEAINMVARGLSWRSGDRVITTILEHHSNLLPWSALKAQGVALDVIGITGDYAPDLSALEDKIRDGTRLVAITHASNVVGVITAVEDVARICREHDVLLLVDGSQSVPHLPIDVRKLGCDFLCFSGHKILGPTGTGVLWMKGAEIAPLMLGGGMIESVSGQEYIPAEGYQRFEAGTPNVAGGIGLGAAVEYLEKIGMDRIRQHEIGLTARLVDGLRAIAGVRVFCPGESESRIGVVSFSVGDLPPHDVARILDENADIMVRSGHHCCQPLMERLGLPNGTVRASLYLYSTSDEVDTLCASVAEIARGM